METQVQNQANKQKLQVSYPGKSKSFTFKDLQSLNSAMSPQNLRLRLKQALEMGKVQKVDRVVKTGGRGRAELVYSLV